MLTEIGIQYKMDLPLFSAWGPHWKNSSACGAGRGARRFWPNGERIRGSAAVTKEASLSKGLECGVGAEAAEFCRRAIAVGDLEACRRRLCDEGLPARVRAELYCRVAEALFYGQDRAAAADCAEAAFALQSDDESIVDFCAWLFSNCRRHAEAAAAYERLLDYRPQWAGGHRHASGAFAAAGRFDRALYHGLRAHELEPAAFDFAFHAGCLLQVAGRWHEAADLFNRAARLVPAAACVPRRLSEIAIAVDEPTKAVDFALRALELAPEDGDHARYAAELLLRAARYDEAVPIIRASLTRDPADKIAWRLLSAAEMLRGRLADAIAAIDHALALTPDSAEYHLHRGTLLYRIADFEAAAAAFGRAAELDPTNPDAKRSQMTVYCDAGRLREAVAVAGELIRAAPDNEEYARAVVRVLNRRFETLDGECILVGEGIPRPRDAARLRLNPLAALATQWRVVHALIIRETRTRFGDSILGYGWALIEPIAHIAMLSAAFAVLMRGRPPIGTQFFLFYYTGLIPFHIFVHSSGSMIYAITSNGPLLQLPLVTTFDVILARGLLELFTDLIVAVLILGGFLAIGIGHLPKDLIGVACSVGVVWVLACGCGFINAVLNALFRSWDKIWNQVARALYFCSGIFYVPGMMPDWIRDILAWNPLLHGIDWFRASFFDDYEPFWLDRRYLVLAAGLALLAGLSLERGLRRQLCELR
jgi:ABC-type polysaccharide/polyol phosphate export permease/Flp pilus assembly protein TadD